VKVKRVKVCSRQYCTTRYRTSSTQGARIPVRRAAPESPRSETAKRSDRTADGREQRARDACGMARRTEGIQAGERLRSDSRQGARPSRHRRAERRGRDPAKRPETARSEHC
jgi:hypothetical protein